MARKPRVPQQQRSIDTRNRILATADKMITELVLSGPGLSELSTVAIIRDAKVSPGTFYDYFPDHDALLDALIFDYVERMEAVILASFSRQDGITEAADVTDHLFVTVADFYNECPGHRALWHGGALQAHRREADRQSDREMVTALTDLIHGLGFIHCDQAVAWSHINLTWRMAESLLWEAFDLALDAGNPLGPPDAAAINAGREIVRRRMQAPKIFTVPA